MSERVTLATLDKGQAVILNQIENIQKDVETKHRQNRDSIHTLNASVQHCILMIFGDLRLKLLGTPLLVAE